MKAESGKTLSLWAGTADVPLFGKLQEDLDVDVCVVGGGISGLTTAYLLAQQRRSVVVLDDNDIGGGATHRTTAHLSNEIDDRYFELIKHLGVDKARLAMESHSSAIDKIEEIAAAEGIECDFKRVDGYLFCAPGQKKKILTQEWEALQQIGYAGAEWMDSTPFSAKLPNEMPCIRYPRQGQFHILKYLTGVARAVVRLGGKIFTYTHVSEIKDGQPAVLKTEGGNTIRAKWVCVTTNSPISDFAKIYLKETAWRTYVVAAEIERGYIDEALFWDITDPYHYIRTQPIEGSDKLCLIVGGEDHRTGQDKEPQVHLTNLQLYVREMFPGVGDFIYEWSGQVMETLDGLAYIGKDPERKDNILTATGDSGMGMTHGTIAGMVLSSIIGGLPNPWIELYDPKRSMFDSPGELVRDMVGTARGYMRHLGGGDVESIDDIAPGQGAVISNKGKKIAVYKDMNGVAQQMSAVCPHMKGLLQWNACEGTWDCGAHGSRFTAEGRVINGPAICDMQCIPRDAQINEAEEDVTPPPQSMDVGDQPST